MSAPIPLPYSVTPLPSKEALVDAYVGKNINDLRTPALVIDRGLYKVNAEAVIGQAKNSGVKFRAHIKTFKSIEGVRVIAETAGNHCQSLIVSTLPEAWHVIDSGLVEEGLIKDILYGLPVGRSKLPDLQEAQTQCGGKAIIRVMVDHPEQVRLIEEFAQEYGDNERVWTVFIKVDGGDHRAGAPPVSDTMKEIIQAISSSKHVRLHGFYSHIGNSYDARSLEEANKYLDIEYTCSNEAAKYAKSVMGSESVSGGKSKDWVLSVGATPTARAAIMSERYSESEGVLELHAGNFVISDLQQLATSLVTEERIAVSVITSVISAYPHRDEAMCDAGGIAMSKDRGPIKGFGKVVHPENRRGWSLGRVSQEHGVLTRDEIVEGDEDVKVEMPRIGEVLRVLPQHACMTCAAHAWYYIVDGGEEVVDVWVPCKGW